MRILLVNMPWALIDVPSLALGIIRRAAQATLPEAEVDVLHANLDYVDWLTERGDFSLNDYYYLALDTYFAGVGDWVFSSALQGDPEWHVNALTEPLGLTPEQDELTRRLHRSAPEFIAGLARQIADRQPDLVGFTSTFQQNTATLAVARALKMLLPQTITVMGGANCDGSQGAALARNFDFLDFVVRGEGEAAFPDLLRALQLSGVPERAAALAAVEGLCWRAQDGSQVENAMSTRPLPPAQILSPDYDGYFERLDASTVRDWVEPKLVVEGARGCWWGAKHHCTFCGLNGSFMQFRSKSPGAFYDEIIELVARHQVMDMYVVDNILDMGYLNSFVPRLAESGYDLRLQYEIKSNLKEPQLRALVEAGIVNVQPGIESLSSRVLKIMDKGVTGCLNVRMLRDSASIGLSVSWNYLYGFPGETEQDYTPILDQFPALHHLPPLEGVARIAIERFSPYFDRPELGFSDLRPDPQYARNYDLPEAEQLALAYLFSAPPQGVGEELGERLRTAAATWQSEYTCSSLSQVDGGDWILLVSDRKGFDWHLHRLADPLELAVFRLLEQPHTQESLLRNLSRGEVTASAEQLSALLETWLELGILFTESEHYIHVVPVAVNQEQLRFARHYDGEAAEASTAPELALV